MHIARRQVRRVLRAIGPHDRTAPLLPWVSVPGVPLPLGTGLDAFALNTMGLGAEALLLRWFLVCRPARRLDRR